MNKATVMKLRALHYSHSTDKIVMTVLCDNGVEYSNNSSFLIWDDENEILTAVKATNDKYANFKCPMEMHSMNYEQIQYITGTPAEDIFEEIVRGLTPKVTDEVIENINDYKNNVIKDYNSFPPYNKTLPPNGSPWKE